MLIFIFKHTFKAWNLLAVFVNGDNTGPVTKSKPTNWWDLNPVHPILTVLLTNTWNICTNRLFCTTSLFWPLESEVFSQRQLSTAYPPSLLLQPFTMGQVTVQQLGQQRYVCCTTWLSNQLPCAPLAFCSKHLVNHFFLGEHPNKQKVW